MGRKESFVKIENISIWYPYKNKKLSQLFKGEKQWVKAVDNVTLELEKGEILGIIGESGCGKSTLGRALARLETPTQGDVLINDISTRNLIKQDHRKFRRSVQIIFQNPFDTFTPRDTIEKILMRPLKLHKIGSSDEERKEKCIEILESGGLKPADEIIKRYPHELSGGQLQRVSILRSMLFNPEFIVADEPVSMLDVSVRAEIINMLLKLSREYNTTVAFISHDISLTRYISDKIAVMYLGKIIEYGDTETIINNPQHPYTQALISNTASIDPNEIREIIKVQGEPPTPVNPGPGCYFAPRCFKATENCFKHYPETVEVEASHLVNCSEI